MAVENQTIKDAASEGTALERYVNVQMGNFIHVFLTLLAVLVMAAACIALVQIVHYGFPQLWHVSDEYAILHELLQKILLLAIAGELGLLLLFHRATAAVEVVMFVIARRMVATDVTAFDLLMGSIALAVLLAVRFYFLPGDRKSTRLNSSHGYISYAVFCLKKNIRRPDPRGMPTLHFSIPARFIVLNTA